jgi:hypothetical protein
MTGFDRDCDGMVDLEENRSWWWWQWWKRKLASCYHNTKLLWLFVFVCMYLL